MAKYFVSSPKAPAPANLSPFLLISHPANIQYMEMICWDLKSIVYKSFDHIYEYPIKLKLQPLPETVAGNFGFDRGRHLLDLKS